MAVLAGHGTPRRLGLKNAQDANNKQVIFVKLTDSALEAFSTYIKNAKNLTLSKNKPSIQFSHNSGTISVPIGQDGNQAKFSFSLSSIEEQNGPQGSFECLESKRPGSLESLGAIQDKIHVQASDDAYTRFGERMSDVKKENEKRTTQFIDRTSNGLVGNKIVSRKTILANKSSNFSSDRGNEFHRYSQTHGHGSRPHGGLLAGSHPMLDRNADKHKRRGGQQPSEIMKRSLRDRIVHILAVRPYKKPELFDRMSRDGLREKDKKDLFPLVKTVCVMKDNTYHLQRHIWNDVSEDWPFYTEEERQAFRRSKPQNLTPPGSDGSTGSVASGHSSSSSHPASPQPSLKRSASSAYLGGDASPMSDHIVSSANALAPLGPQAKKKRVSNYVKPSDLAASRSPMSSLGRSPSNSRSPLPASSTNVMNMTTESGESKTNAWLKTTTATSGVSETSKASSATAAPRFVQGDFLTKFDRVIHSDQRRLYKAEFNKDYTRYMALHRQLEKVSQRFTKLERQLQNTPETSHEHKKLKQLVLNEYQNSKKDPQFIRTREEFQYLHEKLAHIKKLVHDYDTRSMSKKQQHLHSIVAS